VSFSQVLFAAPETSRFQALGGLDSQIFCALLLILQPVQGIHSVDPVSEAPFPHEKLISIQVLFVYLCLCTGHISPRRKKVLILSNLLSDEMTSRVCEIFPTPCLFLAVFFFVFFKAAVPASQTFSFGSQCISLL